MVFTRKKFQLIGARARIKKIFHLLVDLIPAFRSPADLEIVPTYLKYLQDLNPEATRFQFDAKELEQLERYYQELSQLIPKNVQRRKEEFPPKERRHAAKIMLNLRHVLAEKIQQPIKESSLIVLERDLPPAEPLEWPKEIVVVIDHVRSPYNVGAVVRTMECVGLRRILCIGYTPRLDSKQVKRSAMSCETDMNVDYAEDGVDALHQLKKDNEEMGVDESIIAMSDQLIHIPTFGKKNSLNVSIAFSITIYQVWSVVFGGSV